MSEAPTTAIPSAGAAGTADARPRPRSLRALRAQTVRTRTLDPRTVETMYRLFASAYQGTDRARFELDLAEKQYVVMLRDATSRELKGFSTVNVSDAAGARGRRATLVFSGDTVIDPAYWGQKQLQREFSRLLVRLKLRRPWRPLYWFLISKGYKTYLLVMNHCPVAIPRHDRDDPMLVDIRDRAAMARFGERFDAATGVIANVDEHGHEHERVRDGLAPVSAELLRGDAHIRHFVACNPHHERGDELACLAEIRLRDPLRVIAHVLLQRRPQARSPRDLV